MDLRLALTKIVDNCEAHQLVCFVRLYSNVCALRRISKAALLNIKSQWSLFSALLLVDGLINVAET